MHKRRHRDESSLRPTRRVQVGCGFRPGILLAAALPPAAAWAETASTASWIRVTPAEAKALETGDDSVMDKYYDEESGKLQKQRTAAAAVEPNPNGCKLTVADVHWRESTGYTKIGYKPTTTCTTKPIGISYTNELEKHMILGIWKSEWKGLYVLTAGNLSSTTNKKGYTYLNIQKACDNTLSTDWRGKTSSTLKASNGETYYARRYSPHVFTAPCGT